MHSLDTILPDPQLRLARRVSYFIFLILSLAVILRSGVYIDGEWYFTLFDDAMISMKYARNLYEGHGLVWNPGEYVEGYTNPLWTVILAGFHGLGLPESKICLAIMLFCLGLAWLAIRSVERITRRISADEGAVLLALWLTATGFGFLYWTLHGMEVGFITLLLLLSMEIVLQLKDEFSVGRWLLLLLISLAVLLTRMDTLIPMVVIAGWSLLYMRGWGRWLVAAGIGLMCVAALGGLYLFRVEYYGETFPNTYYLKLTGVSKTEIISRGVKRFAGDLLVKGLIISLIPILFAGIKRIYTQAGTMLAALLVGSIFAYSMYVGGDAWEYYLFPNRYISTIFPFFCILIALQMAALRTRSYSKPKFYGLLAACLFVIALMRVSQIPVYNQPLLFMDYFFMALLGITGVLILLPQMRQALQKRLSENGLVIAVLVLAINMPGIVAFSFDTEDYYSLVAEKRMTKLGVSIKQMSQEDTRVAIYMAGAFPYFSHRYCADILGKMDKKIARMKPVRKFIPGHNKWDHIWIMEHYQPDIFVQTRPFFPGDEPAFIAHGYQKQGSFWLNASGLTKVDPAFMTQSSDPEVPVMDK
jgi:hypothetical protein